MDLQLINTYSLLLLVHLILFNIGLLFLIRPKFLFKKETGPTSWASKIFYFILALSALLLGSFTYITKVLNLHILL